MLSRACRIALKPMRQLHGSRGAGERGYASESLQRANHVSTPILIDVKCDQVVSRTIGKVSKLCTAQGLGTGTPYHLEAQRLARRRGSQGIFVLGNAASTSLGEVGDRQAPYIQSAKSVFELVGADSRNRRIRAATWTSDDRPRRAIAWGAGLHVVRDRASVVELRKAMLVGGVGGRRGDCRMSLAGKVDGP